MGKMGQAQVQRLHQGLPTWSEFKAQRIGVTKMKVRNIQPIPRSQSERGDQEKWSQ